MPYIDPGSGGILLQMLGGILIALVAAWGRVRRFFASLFSRRKDPE